MSTMKRLFEDLLEIQRAERSQPNGVDLPTILRLASSERKEFWLDPEEDRWNND
jgi:hypothetical protein